MRGRMGGMFTLIRNQGVALVAQFGGTRPIPTSAWPNPFLIVIGSVTIVALIAYAIFLSRPTLRTLPRIVWSVVWGLLAVLLCLLWVRSYWWQDTLHLNYAGRDTPNYSGTKTVNLTSAQGRIAVSNLPMRWAPRIATNHSAISDTFQPFDYTDDFGNTPSATWFRVMRWSKPKHTSVEFPNWSLAFCFSALAVAPWLCWSNRFGLRTLLIATTLIAVLLGLIVWLTR